MTSGHLWDWLGVGICLCLMVLGWEQGNGELFIQLLSGFSWGSLDWLLEVVV